MQHTIKRSILQNHITNAQKFTLSGSRKNSETEGVFFHTDTVLTVFGVGESRFFSSTLPLTSPEESRSFTLDIKKLSEFLQTLSGEEIKITIGEKKLDIQTPQARASFALVTVVKPTNMIGGQQTWSPFSMKLLSSVYPLVSFACSQDATRPTLSSIRLIPRGSDGTLFVATDGFRLSLVTSPLNLVHAEPLMISSSFLRDVLSVVDSSADAEIWVDPGLTACGVRQAGVEMFSRLIAGDYPPYEKVLVKAHQFSCVFDKKKLQQAIKTVSVFARDFSNIVVFDIQETKTTLRPKKEAGQLVEVDLDLKEKHMSAPLKLAFNYKYVIDLLASVDDDVVTMRANRGDAPVVFLPGSLEDDVATEGVYYQHVIMPVRVQE